MGPKISTGTGQSTKLGSDHRHLKSGLVTFHPTILIFSLFKMLSSVLKKIWTEEKTVLFKFVWKTITLHVYLISFYKKDKPLYVSPYIVRIQHK